MLPVEAKITIKLVFATIELILGLFIAGAFISIITEALVNIYNKYIILIIYYMQTLSKISKFKTICCKKML